MTDLHPGVQAAVDRLTAERYGPSLWWKSKLPDEVLDDSETACARRRRRMAEDFAAINDEEVS